MTRGLVLLLALGAPLTATDRPPTQTIADVLFDFVHVCTAAQRASLHAVIDDDGTTAAERTLAAALLRVNHRPARMDISSLRRLAQDLDQPADVRLLARVLRDLVHRPRGQDRVALAGLVTATPTSFARPAPR